MPAEGYHEFPLAPRDRTWDASAAVLRLRRWASRDGSGEKDQMDWGKYRKVFFWHAENPSDFGDFKLPYCDIINGEPHVVHNACANAKARLPNTDIPASDKEAVARVIDRQLRRFENREQNARTEGGASDTAFGTPTEEQLAKINRLTRRPFKADELFVFTAKFIGDGMVPDRFMKLDRALIEKFTRDALNGDVAYMLNHAWATFGPMHGLPTFGRVFDSWMKESHDLPDETVAQFGSIYVVRSHAEKQGTTANQLIADIESGVLFDVSIGFGYRKAECSVCGNDIRDYRKCEHIPGKEYDGKLCYVIAKPPGDEFEVSSVFAGAYPTASVFSAIDVGEAEPTTDAYVALEVEDIKRVDPGVTILTALGRREATLWVPKGAVQKASFSIASVKEGGNEVNEDDKEKLENTVSELDQTEPEATPADVLTIEKQLVTDVLGKEVTAEELLQLAKDGQTLKADLLEDVLAWGVRADGNAFARDTFAEMLTAASVEQLKKFRESFKAKAQEVLRTGRKTEPREKKEPLKYTIPDEAFKA